MLLCIRPIERENWCVDDVREARQAAIQAAMTSMLNREKKLKRKKAGLRESIVAKIKHTLAVHVTNVHVRFESCGRVRQAIEQPFALGLTLGELRVSSGEKKGKKFTEVVDVGALSLYCVETDAAASTAMSDAELRTFMLAELRRTRPTAECLLQPVGGRASVELPAQRGAKMYDVPGFECSLATEALKLSLSAEQAACLTRLQTFMHRYALWSRFVLLRPAAPPLSRQGAAHAAATKWDGLSGAAGAHRAALVARDLGGAQRDDVRSDAEELLAGARAAGEAAVHGAVAASSAFRRRTATRTARSSAPRTTAHCSRSKIVCP